MAQGDTPELSQRLQELEGLVRSLKNQVRNLEREVAELQLQSAPRPKEKSPSPEPAFKSSQDSFSTPPPLEDDFELDMTETEEPPPQTGGAAIEGEVWLQRIGIVLLLLGVGFLVKYSIDQGWITPAVRLGMGFAVGMALLHIGYRLREERDLLSQVLEGGGIAVFYMVGFASYQWYHLIPHVAAYYYMVAVTVGAYVLCLRQNLASLAVISTLGGLGTPFLLHSGAGNLPGLVAYTCLVLAGALWIYYLKGWDSLFLAGFLGAWAVHSTELWILDRQFGATPYFELAMQGGLLFTWLGFWWMPVLHLLWQNPQELESISTPEDNETSLPFYWSHRWTHLPLALLGGALLTLFFSMDVWHLKDREWGFIILAGSIFYGLVAWRLHARSELLSWLHGLTATALFTIAMAYLFSGHTLLMTLTAEATALHFAAYRLRGRILAFGGHLLFLFIGLWMLERLLNPLYNAMPVFNQRGLIDLVVLIAAVTTSLKVPGFSLRKPYLTIVYLALLFWWVRELNPLNNTNAWVSIAWGLQGTALFILGLRRNHRTLSRAGFATLAVVAGKMILIDLANLETLWRILLFLGIGAGFLGLSYLARDVWKPSTK